MMLGRTSLGQVLRSSSRGAWAEYSGFNTVSGGRLTWLLERTFLHGILTRSLKVREAATTSSKQVTTNAIRTESQVTQKLLSPDDDQCVHPVKTLLERIEGCLRECFQLPILNHLSFAFQHCFMPSASKHQDYRTMQKKIFCIVTPGDRCYCWVVCLGTAWAWAQGELHLQFEVREACLRLRTLFLQRTELHGLQRTKAPTLKLPAPKKPAVEGMHSAAPRSTVPWDSSLPCPPPGPDKSSNKAPGEAAAWESSVRAGPTAARSLLPAYWWSSAKALARQATVLHWLICTLTSLLLKRSFH